MRLENEDIKDNENVCHNNIVDFVAHDLEDLLKGMMLYCKASLLILHLGQRLTRKQF